MLFNNRADFSEINMDFRVMPLLTLLAVLGVSDAFQCYECEWREVAGFDSGDDDCLKVRRTTDISEETSCNYCITKTLDKFGHNWIERSCSTATSCRDAKEEETWEDDIYTVQKRCCSSNKCNKETFKPDSGAGSLQLAIGLLAAMLISLCANFRL